MARRGEHPSQDPGTPLRFLGDLLFAEPDHLEALGSEVEIASPIVLKGLAAAVVAVAVGFDDLPLLTPEEVDEMAVDADVHLRKGQPVATADPEEVALEVAPCAIALNPEAKRQAKNLCLPGRSPQLPVRDGTAKVRDGTARLRDWDAAAIRGVTHQEGRTAMDPDSFALPSIAGGGQSNVDRPVERRQQPPERSGASVADDCSLPTGKCGCHPSPVGGNPRVPNGVDSSVNMVQTTCVHPPGYRARAQT
jgi:hypothetical protein